MRIILIATFMLVAWYNGVAQQSTVHCQSTSEKQDYDWVLHYFVTAGFHALPAPSVDIPMLYHHIKQHPNRWKTVCYFMTHNDLSKLPLGVKVLSDKVFVNIQEYTTRDPGVQHLEAHRKYIDFQYVVSGRELMGSGKLADAKDVVPYNSKKDAGNYTLPIFPYYVATPEYFFVFFPSQVHLTNIQFGDKALVRKLVFKVMYK